MPLVDRPWGPLLSVSGRQVVMLETIDILMNTRVLYYGIGVFVVLLVVFTTAAKKPNPHCPRCKEINRPMARYCAHCGQPLGNRG